MWLLTHGDDPGWLWEAIGSKTWRDAQLDEAQWPRLLGKRERVNASFVYVHLYICISASRGSCRGGGGVSQKLAIAPHPSPPPLGTHMDSDRLEEKEGGEPERGDGEMPACLPLGTQMILMACLLHPLCPDPLKHYQFKTDPGLSKLQGWMYIFPIYSIK